MTIQAEMRTRQAEIEKQYSRKSIRTRIIDDIEQDHLVFKRMVEEIDQYRKGSYYTSKANRIKKLAAYTNEDLAAEVLIAVLPIKEISPIQAVATRIGASLRELELLDGVKVAAELLAVTEVSGCFSIYHTVDYENNTGTMGIRANYSLNAETAAFIDQTMYLPPMVCKPVKWKSNTNGGHLQGSSSILLGHLNHHEQQQAIDVINILQSIPWTLNSMIEFVEEPSKDLDTDQKVKQFELMAEQSSEVYKQLINNGNQFYFVWKYDKRGRMYSQGYHCNLQSTEYKKAILEFAEKEYVVID